MTRNMITGDQLHPEDRQAVLAAYVYRMTVESVERWPYAAAYMRAHGWRMTVRTDRDWLASTRFAVRKDGRLDRRARYCQTTH